MVWFYENGIIYAIKEKELPQMEEPPEIDEAINRFYIEYKVTKYCEHPHIIKFFNFFRPEDTNSNAVTIVMEYSPLGDIGSFSGYRTK